VRHSVHASVVRDHLDRPLLLARPAGRSSGADGACHPDNWTTRPVGSRC